jgi:hypothetical protein
VHLKLGRLLEKKVSQLVISVWITFWKPHQISICWGFFCEWWFTCGSWKFTWNVMMCYLQIKKNSSSIIFVENFISRKRLISHTPSCLLKERFNLHKKDSGWCISFMVAWEENGWAI